jgi:tetratricopeptide (TPR) repeat protein
VHRDIKPSNLLVNAEGHLWVTDFGLAMTQADAGLTMTGELLGTLRYMSPEQISGARHTLDHRTDVYSLGVTLYELLTCRALFDATNRGELLHRISSTEPRSPRKLRRDIPADLDTIIGKTLEKDPADRYPVAQALADDLQRYLDDRPIVARPPRWRELAQRWTRRHALALSVALCVALFVVIVLGTSTVLVVRARDEARFAEHERSEEAAKAIHERNEARRHEADSQRQRDAAEQRGRLADRNLQTTLQIIEDAVALNDNTAIRNASHGAETHADRQSALLTEAQNIARERAIALLETLIVTGSDDPFVRRESAIASARMLVLRTGRWEDRELQDVIERLSGSLVDFPDDAPLLYELAKVYDRRGVNLSWRAGSGRNDALALATAVSYADRAVELFNQVKQQLPATRFNERDLIVAHQHRAHIYSRQQRWDRARQEQDLVSRYWTLLDELEAKDETSTTGTRDMLPSVQAWRSMVRAARLEKRDDTEKERQLRGTIAIIEALPSSEWFDVMWIPPIVEAYADLASLHSRQRRMSDVQLDLVSLRDDLERALRELPSDPTKELIAGSHKGILNGRETHAEFRADRIARSFERLASSLRFHKSDPIEIEQALSVPFAIWEHACQSSGEFRGQWQGLNEAATALGEFLVVHGRYTDAAPVLQRAMMAETKLFDMEPENSRRPPTTRLLELLGESLVKTGRRFEAREVYRRWLDVSRPILARPNVPIGTRLLQVRTLVTLASLEEHSATREILYREAVLVAEGVVDGVQNPAQEIRGAGSSPNLSLCEALIAYAEFLADAGRRGEAICQITRVERIVGQFTEKQYGYSLAIKGLARFLVTSSDPQLRNASKAAQLVQPLVQSGGSHVFWTIRGICDYRLDKFASALLAFKSATEQSAGGTAEMWYFLAMTHWQLGNKLEARTWYEKAQAWMEKQPHPSDEILRFRDEAAALFATGDASPFPPPPALPTGEPGA